MTGHGSTQPVAMLGCPSNVTGSPKVVLHFGMTVQCRLSRRELVEGIVLGIN